VGGQGPRGLRILGLPRVKASTLPVPLLLVLGSDCCWLGLCDRGLGGGAIGYCALVEWGKEMMRELMRQ